MSIRVGTSGWSYPHWRGRFYPSGLGSRDWLTYYSSHFETVEINATFYRLPTLSTVERWRRLAPPGFAYVVKGSRLITHIRRLDAPAAAGTFLSRIERLRPALGAVLWQLPPDFERDVDRLDAFLGALPDWTRPAVEFRHGSWRTDEVYAVLERHGAANVAASTPSAEPDLTMTGDFAYVRFHGLGGGYAHDYIEAELRPWLRYLFDAGEGFAFFNNDGDARAPKNAGEFAEMVARGPATDLRI
jgi:uncharacterized protein YecE (DUF72 family)